MRARRLRPAAVTADKAGRSPRGPLGEAREDRAVCVRKETEAFKSYSGHQRVRQGQREGPRGQMGLESEGRKRWSPAEE